MLIGRLRMLSRFSFSQRIHRSKMKLIITQTSELIYIQDRFQSNDY